MRDLGAASSRPGSVPHVCGGCYEVPEQLRADVAAVVPAALATTSWGTPSVDLGAGVHAQLVELDVDVHDESRCTRESPTSTPTAATVLAPADWPAWSGCGGDRMSRRDEIEAGLARSARGSRRLCRRRAARPTTSGWSW